MRIMDGSYIRPGICGEDDIRTVVGIEFRFSWCLSSTQVNYSLLRYFSFTKIFVTEYTESAYSI
jgi:hypothetical protein